MRRLLAPHGVGVQSSFLDKVRAMSVVERTGYRAR